MTIAITINLWVVGGIILWLAIGGVFAWTMAISPQAVVILMVAWPIFLVLILLSPVINYFANRNLN